MPASRCDNYCGCARARVRRSNQPSCWCRRGDSSWWRWIWATRCHTCPPRHGYACARSRSDREPWSYLLLVFRSQDRFQPHRCSYSRRTSISDSRPAHDFARGSAPMTTPWHESSRIPRWSRPWRARFHWNEDADQPSKPHTAPWSSVNLCARAPGHEGGGHLCASPVLMLRRSLCRPCCAAWPNHTNARRPSRSQPGRGHVRPSLG